MSDALRNVEINIGKVCNSRCAFCLDGDPDREQRRFMPWEDMKGELERYHADGFRSVGFLGGEPTVYPHLVEAVAHAKALGFQRIALASNAMRLSDAAFADALVDAGLTRVTVSMHAHTAALEDRLTRKKGSYERKCTAIRYLKSLNGGDGLKDGVSVNVVLNAWNYRTLPKMMRFVYEDLGLDDMRVNFIRPEGRAEGSADLTPRYADVVPVLVKAIVLNERHFRRTFTFGGFPMCMLPKQLLDDDKLLRRYMGEYRDLPTDCSIKSEPLAEQYPDGVSQIEGGRARFNWQDRKRNDLKDGAEVCRSCAKNQVCEGVWKAYLDLHGDDEFGAFEE